MQKIPMLINVDWVYADEERLVDVMNPSTGEVLAQISNQVGCVNVPRSSAGRNIRTSPYCLYI